MKKLNIIERISLLSILPSVGNFVTLKVVRQLREMLSFSEDEIKEYEIKEIKTNGGSVLSWNVDKANEEKEFEFGDIATEMIITSLSELNKNKKLEEKHYSIYEKFIENEN